MRVRQENSLWIIVTVNNCDRRSWAVGPSREAYNYHKLTLEVKQVKRQELELFVVCKVYKSVRQAKTTTKNKRCTQKYLDLHYTTRSWFDSSLNLERYLQKFKNKPFEREMIGAPRDTFVAKVWGSELLRIFVRGQFISVTLRLRLVLLASNFVSLCSFSLLWLILFFLASDVLFGNASNLVFRLFLRVRKGYWGTNCNDISRPKMTIEDETPNQRFNCNTFQFLSWWNH